MLQHSVIDIVDQLPLHVHRTAFMHGLLDCIMHLLLRFDRINRSIAALEVDTLVRAVVAILVAVAIAIGGIMAEKVSSRSDHVCARSLLVDRPYFQ